MPNAQVKRENTDKWGNKERGIWTLAI